MGLEMRISETRWSDCGGRQDAGSQIEMVRACDEEMQDPPLWRCERFAMDGFRRGRGRGEVLGRQGHGKL